MRVLEPAGTARAVALVLHGGRVSSREPVHARDLSVARMIPFARALHGSGAPYGLEVWRVRNRVRGWNGADESPVGDARWALDRIADRHPGVPVVLVGHSMGGRTALRVAGHPSVRAVVALAPWVPDGEPVDGLRGRQLTILHGTADRLTDPRGSRELARRAAGIAASVRHVELRGAGHSMLSRPALWHGLTSLFALSALSDAAGQDAGPSQRPGHGGPLVI